MKKIIFAFIIVLSFSINAFAHSPEAGTKAIISTLFISIPLTIYFVSKIKIAQSKNRIIKLILFGILIFIALQFILSISLGVLLYVLLE